ncbi:hypothetical protein [Halomonas sp.]|uniref:hypothetical protein n=1 Tax=Halomonas sp. TaxID=1486246 RepID=UPI003D1149D2
MPRKWTEWPRRQLDQLEELIGAGLTYAQVAERIGRPESEVIGAAQRIGLQDPARMAWRRRTDWPEIERIMTDCIEAKLMTIPQTRQYLIAVGHPVSLGGLYERLKTMPRDLQRRARANGKKRRAACCSRMRRRQEVQRKRQQEAA